RRQRDRYAGNPRWSESFSCSYPCHNTIEIRIEAKFRILARRHFAARRHGDKATLSTAFTVALWQHDGYLCALARCALDREITAVRMHNALTDRQAQPGSSVGS